MLNIFSQKYSTNGKFVLYSLHKGELKMLGDIILWLKSFKKELFCIHEYGIRWIGTQCYKSCKKCGRVK